MGVNFECRATAIGSFPYENSESALDLIRENLKDIPVWPQLPKRGYKECMCPQYSEGVPGVSIDTDARRLWVDTTGDLLGDVEKFYEKFLAEDAALFGISEEYSAGFHSFVREFASAGGELFAVKGHVTGPVTWGLTVTDQDKKASYYNEFLKDCIVKGMMRKAQWQIDLLKRINPRVIIFVDEPYLQSIGSSTVSLDREDVGKSLEEVFDGIKAAGAIPGIHCCGNTDWGFIAETGVSIINFDAFEFGETMSLYPKPISAFLERGGNIAFGIVPSSNQALAETAESIVGKFRAVVSSLVKQGIPEERLLEQALITPSCGVGSLETETAEKAIVLNRMVSDILRGKS